MAHVSASRLQVSHEPHIGAVESADTFPCWLRVATVGDVSVLEQLEREAFPTLTAGTPFRQEIKRANGLYLLAVRAPRSGEAEEAGRERFARRAGWLRRLLGLLMFEGRAAPVRLATGEVVSGAVGVWYMADECHIVIIATRPGERRRGIGELLLIGAVEDALKRGSRIITLEVRASNEAARALYRKYGFEDAGRRKRYYSDNKEDAIIMTTRPIQSMDYREAFAALLASHGRRWGKSFRPAT
jgi:ribosomal-protein-alanine N-acetyltransferase